jgi:adenosine deaminase
LKLTVHFAEVEPQKPLRDLVQSDDELDQLMKLRPHRLGHVIHVQPEHKQAILDNNIGLELCLSCNVIGKLTKGNYADHHFGWWWKQNYNMIALCVSTCLPLLLSHTFHEISKLLVLPRAYLGL